MTQSTHRRRPSGKKRRKQGRTGLLRVILLLTAMLAGFGILRCLDSGVLRPAAKPEENPLKPSDFATVGGYVTCTAVPTRRGVDVSQYQEQVDWQQVYEAGFDFAFVRIGYRGNTSGDIYAWRGSIWQARRKPGWMWVSISTPRQFRPKRPPRKQAGVCPSWGTPRWSSRWFTTGNGWAATPAPQAWIGTH